MNLSNPEPLNNELSNPEPMNISNPEPMNISNPARDQIMMEMLLVLNLH